MPEVGGFHCLAKQFGSFPKSYIESPYDPTISLLITNQNQEVGPILLSIAMLFTVAGRDYETIPYIFKD